MLAVSAEAALPSTGLPDFAEVGPEAYRPLRRELRAYYPEECHERMRDPAVSNSFARIWSDVETWFAAHPEADALDVRRENYRAIRRHFRPVLFRESPFYFESGVAGGYSVRYDRGSCSPGNVTRLLCMRFYHDRGFVPDEEFRVLSERSRQRYSYICGPFVDQIHNMPPFKKILENGFGGMRAQVEKALAECPAWDREGRRYLEVMLEGFDTVHAIQLAFAKEAKRLLCEEPTAGAPSLRRWRRIAEAAERCPWEPPRTFFEGLNTLWFCREVFGYMDGLSCFSLGHPDMWLIDLYRRDLAAGRISESEMRDLVRRFMIQAECHHNGFRPVDGSVDHEMETPITLGGTDAKGTPVWNELTQAFLEEHLAMDLVFPKLHVRYSKDSPKEYLEAIAKLVLEGHSVFAMFNDETHVRGFLKDGYSLERACDYEGVGCWEGAISSSTDVQFANYTSVIKPFVAAIYRDPEAERRARVTIEPFEGCASIDELKRRALRNYLLYVRDLLATYTHYGRFFSKVAPRPLYSACLDGCVERRRDEFDLGLKFQPRSLTLGFLANVVDSICAIDKVVFKDRLCTLDEFLSVVRSNWAGERGEALRAEALKAPYWGDNSDESNGLMKWWIDSISEGLAGFTTDQGGPNKLACLIYREFLYWGADTPATPDGRRSGDRFAQGFAPSEYRCKSSVTDVFNAIGSLDHSRLWASNANLMFDGSGLTPETLGATFRVFAKKGAHMLQPNCVSVETLLDAQKHPERHMNIIVKVCGFSARFVALSPRWQQEVIERHRLKGWCGL